MVDVCPDFIQAIKDNNLAHDNGVTLSFDVALDYGKINFSDIVEMQFHEYAEEIDDIVHDVTDFDYVTYLDTNFPSVVFDDLINTLKRLARPLFSEEDKALSNTNTVRKKLVLNAECYVNGNSNRIKFKNFRLGE